MTLEYDNGQPRIRYEALFCTRWFYPSKDIDVLKLQEAWMGEEGKTDHAWMVLDRHKILSFGFPTKAMAEDWTLEQAEEETKEPRKGKTRFLPPTLEHIVQTDHSIPITAKEQTGERLMETFGFRGRGGALAHFEPAQNVINLTKWKGAGSLGHEWVHALDYAIGQKIAEKLTAPVLLASDRPTFLIREDWPKFAALLDGLKYRGRYQPTEFYKQAKKLDQTYQKTQGRYWSSSAELLARAGAVYLYDKLKEQGIRDDYLSGHATLPGICPTGEERKTFDHLFDEALEEWKGKGLLHDRAEDRTEETVQER